MLTTEILNRLRNNWGDKADAMACFAEARMIDPDSSWACYILALNPFDDDEINCIIDGFTVEHTKWSLQALLSTFNSSGNYVIFDIAYRPRRAAELFKTLCEGKENGTIEN